jgi:Bacterial TSP3 repeat
MKTSNCPGWKHFAATALIASSSVAYALPTAADSFLTGGAPNYDAGPGFLIFQNPTIAGFSGSWLPAYGGAQSPDVIETGLTYSTVPSSGGAIEYPGGGNGRAGRVLTIPYNDASSGTVYYTVMMKMDSTGTGYRGLELHTLNFDDNGANRRLQIVVGEGGTGAPAGNLGVRINGNNNAGFIGDLGPVDTNVNFFVVKITFSPASNSDVVSIWRNPPDLTSEALAGTPNFVSTGLDFAFDRVSFARFNGDSGFRADEIKIGSTWADVTAAPNNSDTDSDGLPDAWELVIINFNPNDAVTSLADVKGPLNAPATSDFDGDGSSDAQEFARTTLATNPDTDGDGLNDGPETGTAIFVSSSDTGTDPLDNDSDNDGLQDGPEVTVYFTNPLSLDTDSDTESDSLEVVQGSDPNNNASFAAVLGIATVDGQRDDALYSTPLVLQTVNTEFGDNFNEWNGGYAYVNAGKLYLMFTGNLENSFNKLEIFIDSKAGGSSTFTSAGNDGAGIMNGMKFDSNFAPEYHLIARRGSSKFDLDIANLIVPNFNSYQNVFGNSDSGSGFTGTGVTNAFPIRVGYNGSNSLGIEGGTGAADQVAAAAVSTGLELCINLADLGNPSGPIKVMLLQNNNNHNFLSNQTLGGLPAGFGNLGDPANTKDFSAYAGDQFFSIDLSPVHLLASGSAIRFKTSGLTLETAYKVQESTTLTGFSDVAGSEFTATNSAKVVTLPVTPGTDPKKFFRIRSVAP